VVFPLTLDNIRRREVTLRSYVSRSLEHSRRAQSELFTYQNSRKARLGNLAVCKTRRSCKASAPARSSFVKRSATTRNSAKRMATLGACGRVARSLAQDLQRALSARARHGVQQPAVHRGRHLVRLADGKTAKPNSDRLREYAKAGLDSLRQELFSEAPILYRPGNDEAGRLAQFLLELAGPTVRWRAS